MGSVVICAVCVYVVQKLYNEATENAVDVHLFLVIARRLSGTIDGH